MTDRSKMQMLFSADEADEVPPVVIMSTEAIVGLLTSAGTQDITSALAYIDAGNHTLIRRVFDEATGGFYYQMQRDGWQ